MQFSASTLCCHCACSIRREKIEWAPWVNKAFCYCKRSACFVVFAHQLSLEDNYFFLFFPHLCDRCTFSVWDTIIITACAFSTAYSSPWESHPSLAPVLTGTPRFHRGGGCTGPPTVFCQDLGAVLCPAKEDLAITTTLLFLLLPFCRSFAL